MVVPMSIQDVGWVLDQDIQNPGAKLVLVCIANHIHSRMDYAFPSIDNIALEASMSRRSVQRHIKWLEDQEYLVIERSFDGNSRQTSNRYRLNLDRCETQNRGDKLAPSPEQEENEIPGGGCQIDTEEGDTGDTLGGDNVVTPLIGKITGINNSPLPPEAGGGAALADGDWEKLSEGWLLALGDSFERARRPWARLSMADQGLALKHAKAFQQDKPKAHLTTYIRQKRWQSYEQAALKKQAAQFVFIEKGSPEWFAWCNHKRSAIFSSYNVEHRKEGCFQRSRWPPGYEADTKQAG